jgi:hypothetical protein
MKNELDLPSRLPRRLLAAAALGLLLATGLVVSRGQGEGASAASTPGPAAISADAQAILPGAQAELVAGSTGYNGEGQVLRVEVPQEMARAKVGDPFAIADAAWRARMLAADLAAEVPALTGYQLRSQGISPAAVPPAVLGELTGTLPPPVAANALRNVGTVPIAAARAQLDSNISVLRKHVPTITNVTVQSLELPEAGSHVALAVEVESSAIEDLRPFLGDIFLGLQTGLVGDGNAVIDGLAITLWEGSKPVAGSWMATRALTGAVLTSPEFKMPASLVTTLPFVSSTGGPVPHAAATLGVASEAPHPAE